MTLIETKQDLFSVSNNYALVRCISADFVMGSGIAKEFTLKELMRKLSADEMIQYLKDNGLNVCPMVKELG